MSDRTTSETCHDSDAGAILAAIVVYHPDPESLIALVETLKAQVAGIVLFLNSMLPEELRQRLRCEPKVSTIEAVSNLGIGAGLNISALHACLRDAADVVFFDQDSRPSGDLVERLCAARRSLVDAGHRPAVVSPLLVVPEGATSKAPTYRFLDPPAEGARRVAFVPTSGSLIAMEVLRRIGLFRADFFIDGIDLEWSFRAASRGFSCWVTTDCAMPHAVGAGVIGLRWLGWHMPKQRPFRMYCVIRNTVYGLRLGHIPLGWKVKQMMYLPLQACAFALHHRMGEGVVPLLALAVYDGMRGRLGAPRGLFGAREARFDAL